jgi:hypothetical protein
VKTCPNPNPCAECLWLSRPSLIASTVNHDGGDEDEIR